MAVPNSLHELYSIIIALSQWGSRKTGKQGMVFAVILQQ